MKNPFKKQEPIIVTPEEHEVRIQNFGGLMVQNPYHSAGIYDNHQDHIRAASQNALTDPTQLQNYQNQIKQDIQTIQQNHMNLGQNLFVGKNINIDGKNLRVTSEDYDFIIAEGYKALLKQIEYKNDFDKLLK
jgi:hypothetical protein